MPSSGRENLGYKLANSNLGDTKGIRRARSDIIAESTVRPKCFLDVSIERKPAGRIVCELFSDQTPKTAENFRCLCTGERGEGRHGLLHYKGSKFHRIIPNFMCQAGDFTHGDGTGGESIYGQVFPDESFKIKHNTGFLLSMANCGPDTNGSQFFITTKATPHLDGKHCVFGRIVEGKDIVLKLEECGTSAGNTLKLVTIEDCGEVGSSADDGGVAGGFAKRPRIEPAEVRLFHILKKHSGSRDPKNWRGQEIKGNKSKAVNSTESLRKRILMTKEEDRKRTFVDLAREHSDCTSAQKGGDLGTLQKSDLAPELSKIAFALDPNEISNPVSSVDGVHILFRGI